MNTETRQARIIRFQQEGSKLMLNGFRMEVDSSDSSKHYYKQAINKFLSSYFLDTTLLESAIYLPDLYFKINKPDSALYWKSKLSPIDSI